jgi:hypothetical protein
VTAGTLFHSIRKQGICQARKSLLSLLCLLGFFSEYQNHRACPNDTDFAHRITARAAFPTLRIFLVHLSAPAPSTLSKDAKQTKTFDVLKWLAVAIHDKPIVRESGIITHIDNTKCLPIFIEEHACGICIKVCPLSCKSYEKIKESFLKKNAGLNL